MSRTETRHHVVPLSQRLNDVHGARHEGRQTPREPTTSKGVEESAQARRHNLWLRELLLHKLVGEPESETSLRPLLSLYPSSQ